MPFFDRTALAVMLALLGCGAQSGRTTAEDSTGATAGRAPVGAAGSGATGGQGQGGATAGQGQGGATAGQGQGGAPVPSRCADATTPLELGTASGNVNGLIAIAGSTLLAIDGGAARLIDLETRVTRALATDVSGVLVGALDAHEAYLVASSADNTTGFNLFRVPLTGTEPSQLISSHAGGIAPLPYQDVVYFREEGSPDDASAPMITKWAPGASAPEVLVHGAGSVLQMATDGSSLNWAACTLGIERAPLTGGAPEYLADAYCPAAIAVEGGELYFVDLYTDMQPIPRMGRVNLATGEVTGFANDVQPWFGLAVDATSVFVGHEDGLWRIDRATERGEKLAEGHVGDILLDDSCVYWVDPDVGRVYVLER